MSVVGFKHQEKIQSFENTGGRWFARGGDLGMIKGGRVGGEAELMIDL